MAKRKLSDKAQKDNASNTKQSLFMEKIVAVFEQNYKDRSFGIQALARAIPVSTSQLYRKIKTHTGYSPSIYLRNLRLEKSKKLLVHSKRSVSDIAYSTGFSDPAYFSRSFSKAFGISPINFRKCNNNPNN